MHTNTRTPQNNVCVLAHGWCQMMEFCLSCQNFSLHAFSRAPDGACSYKLSAIEQAVAQGCSFCSFLNQQIQSSLIAFPVHLSKCWVRIVIPTRPELGIGKQPGLRLSEVEVYLADSALKTKNEQRSQTISLGLAASPSTLTCTSLGRMLKFSRQSRCSKSGCGRTILW